MKKKACIKGKKTRKRRIVVDIPIFELVNILENYNKENKTRYSYGQFIMLLSNGIIKIGR